MTDLYEKSVADVVLSKPLSFIKDKHLLGARASLSLPWESLLPSPDFNHVAAPSAVCEVMADRAKQKYARRFIVSDEVSAVAHMMVKNRSQFDLARKAFAIPCDIGWIEWSQRIENNVVYRYGAFWERVDDCYLFRFVTCYKDLIETFGCFTWHPNGDCFGRVIPSIYASCGERFVEDMVQISITSVVCIFTFMSMARTCKIAECVPDRALQKARVKRGKLPLLSFNKVFFRQHEQKPTTQHLDGYGRVGVRFHDVAQHYRTIYAADGQARLTTVSMHWRGDPSLGVVLKQRNLVADHHVS